MTYRRPPCGWTPDTKCSALGCNNDADPRWAMHGPGGQALPACDGHLELPCRATDQASCVCPPTKPDRSVERAYLEHLGAAASYAWRLQYDDWSQGATSPRATGFWLHQPRALRRLADMPKWAPLCQPPLETRDGPDPRASCPTCRGHGRTERAPIACPPCRGTGVVWP